MKQAEKEAEDDDEDELEHVEEEAEDDKEDEEEKEMKQEEEEEKKRTRRKTNIKEQNKMSVFALTPFHDIYHDRLFLSCVVFLFLFVHFFFYLFFFFPLLDVWPLPPDMHPPNTVSLHSLVHTSFHSSLQRFHLYTYTGDLIPRGASPDSILRTAVDVSATHYQMTGHSHTAFDTAFVQGGVPCVVTCVHLILPAAQAVQRDFL